MQRNERRWYTRLEMEMRVVLHAGGENFSAVMIDMSKCSIGVISERAIAPGVELHFSFKYIEDFTIRGTVKWSCRIREAPELYRMGIETSSVLLLKEIQAAGITGRSESIKALLTD